MVGSSRDGSRILRGKPELAQHVPQAGGIVRIAFVGSRRFPQVVAQGWRGRALEGLGENRFRPVLLQARRRVEALQLGMGEREEHPVSPSPRARKKGGALSDAHREVVDIRRPRIQRGDATGAKDVEVHEEAVEERINPAITHRRWASLAYPPGAWMRTR